MIVWLKVAHILALMVWCAGLLVFPSLYVQRNRVGSRDELDELQRVVRMLYIGVTSPAAFVAVVAGTALMFAREVFSPWMMAKLVAVGVLVMIHVRDGYVVLGLFEPGRRYGRWRGVLGTATTLCAIATVLALVLAKPELDPDVLPAWLRQPGGLQSLLETMRPMP